MSIAVMTTVVCKKLVILFKQQVPATFWVWQSVIGQFGLDIFTYLYSYQLLYNLNLQTGVGIVAYYSGIHPTVTLF